MEHRDFPIHEIMDGKIIKAKSPFDLDFPQEYVNGIGSGGIYSTASDLCLFLDALREGKLVDAEGLAAGVSRCGQYNGTIWSGLGLCINAVV